MARCDLIQMKSRFFLVGLSLSCGCAAARAADPIDLGTVGIGGGTGAQSAASSPPNPPAAAPTQTPLSVTQPSSLISGRFIEKNIPLSGTYDDIIRITPSVVANSPNGPGLSEAVNLTIRGFADGQYNVLFDGIPFADADDFTHHTSAYFMAHDLGSVNVERGPGTASTIGNATFGGTVSLLSRSPAADFNVTPYTSLGSFGTRLFGTEVDSGAVAGLNGGSLMLDVEHVQSDGYLTGSGQERSDVFFKAVQPIGENTLLTIVATTERQHQYVPVGATREQIAAIGPNFGLSGSPTAQNYFGYNSETYRTDFAYVGIQSQLTDQVSLDNKIYTYALYRHFRNGEDVNGETPNGTAFSPTDVPGQAARNDLRAFGDVFRLSDNTDFGVIRVGLWLEHQGNQRSQTEVDMTLGGVPNPVLSPVTGVAGSATIDRLQRETLDTLQPYIEADWKITEALTLTPGIKGAIFDRNVDAPVMEGTRLTLHTDATYAAPVPALVLHYAITPTWSAYAQVAKGFLAPQLQFLDVPDPKSNPVQPEQTWNYQIGTSWHGKPLGISADVYYIDFSNMVGSRTVGSETQVFNEGGVNYLGVEGDATLSVGSGFSLYANGSVNSARQTSNNAPVPNTPQATMAGGILYDRDGWYGSAIDKWVGARYGDVDRQQGLAPFNQLDFNVGGRLTGLVPRVPPIKVQFSLLNVLDSGKIFALAGYTAANNTPLWFTQPGRSAFASVSVQF
jgi:iron complex outermembrane receptor protein